MWKSLLENPVEKKENARVIYEQLKSTPSLTPAHRMHGLSGGFVSIVFPPVRFSVFGNGILGF